MSFSKEGPVIPNHHLSFDQIRGVASTGASSLPPAASGHLGDCRQCAELVKFVNGLGEVKPDPATNLGDCPSQVVLLEIAEGLTVPDTSLYRHITQCHRCVTALRDFAEDLKDDNLPETKDLRTASPGWQHALAEKIASSTEPTLPEPRRSRLPWIQFRPRARWVYAGALAMVFCSGVVFWLEWRSRPSYADQLLAQAYAEQRTLELRIPGGHYAPVRSERGADRSRLSRPRALLEAEAIIARKLAQNPSDPVWLQAKARADLLDGNHDSALQSLRRALEAQPDSPSLLTDIASAYFERAETEDRAVDYANAIEFLGRALARAPDDRVALYNRAIVFERMFLYTQAVEEWQHYLRLDPTGDWAEDARRHLGWLQEKLKKHAQSVAEPLLDPAQFVEVTQGGDPEAKAAIDQRIEAYLNRALTDWLPMAFPESSATSFQDDSALRRAPNARAALAALARTLSQEHHDRWLGDLLTSSSAQGFGAAISALSAAISANVAHRPEAANRDANEAERLFRISGNAAGIMRAKLEEVYALHWLPQGRACLDTADILAKQVQGRTYAWIQIQLQLEQFSCSNLVGSLQRAESALRNALPAALKAGYPTLYLRGLGFSAALLTEKGDPPAAWSLNRSGLARYWEGIYPSARANQFYADMCFDAEGAAYWQLAVPLAREAVRAIPSGEKPSFEAMSHYRVARDALMIGNTDEAAHEFTLSRRIFDKLPQDESTTAYRADSDLGLAKMQLEKGELNEAESTIATLHERLSRVSSYFIALDFYQTWGELQRRRGNYNEAEKALRTAIVIAEKKLKSLRKEADGLTWSRETAPSYRSLVQVNLKLEGRAEASLELWEWYKAAPLRVMKNAASGNGKAGQGASPAIDSVSLSVNPSLPPMDEVRRSLYSLTRETIISYAELPEGLAIWTYDDRGITTSWLPVSRQTLDTLAAHFRDLCADPESDTTILNNDARRLYDLLVAPVEQRLTPRRTLVFELDGMLSEIPMRALVDPTGRYLGDLYSVVLSPGLIYEQRLAPASAISTQDRAFVIGSPATAGSEERFELDSLADATREAEVVAGKFHDATFFRGRQASLKAVDRYLGNADIFHFAGHAVTTPGGVALVLAIVEKDEHTGRSLLNADYLGERKLKCRLVVLSACATGQGEDGSLASPESLVRAFLRAGVPHVVASHWNVNSATTASFMTLFYSALLSGNPVPVALKTAAQEIHSQGATVHPYYWAAFEAYGRM